jgi:hypothetical protein
MVGWSFFGTCVNRHERNAEEGAIVPLAGCAGNVPCSRMLSFRGPPCLEATTGGCS